MTTASVRRLVLALMVGGVLGLGARAALRPTRAASVEAPPQGLLLGSPIPGVTLQTPGGDSVKLRDQISGRVSLIAVLGARDCWNCGDYPVELRALHNLYPHLVTLLVGSDADIAALRDYFDRYRATADALLDPRGILIRQLGGPATPLLLLYDRAGRLVFVDRRTGPQSAGYRIGELLPDLAAALDEIR